MTDTYKLPRRSHQPPVEYEQKTGTTGIAGRYRYPGGMTAEQYDCWIVEQGSLLAWEDNSPETVEKLKNTFNELAALNPEIRNLPHRDMPRRLRHSIFGVASSMNTDDIRFFIEYPEKTGRDDVARAAHGDPDYDRLTVAVQTRTGVGGSWVASPKTLRRIFEQVKDRPAIHPVQTPQSWRPPQPL
jgi:hypothetical protein